MSDHRSQRLGKLPRLARISFLFNCCDRITPLIYAKCARLLPLSLVDTESPYKRAISITKIAGDYSLNQHLFARNELEKAKEDAADLEAKAFAAGCMDYAFDVARALQELMACCINAPEKQTDDPYERCFSICYLLMFRICSAKGVEAVDKQLDEELDAYEKAAAAHGWTDDSPPTGAWVFPGWKNGNPDGWPAASGVTVGADMLVNIAKSGPAKLFMKIWGMQ